MSLPKILRLKNNNELEEFLSGIEQDNYECNKDLEEMEDDYSEEEE